METTDHICMVTIPVCVSPAWLRGLQTDAQHSIPHVPANPGASQLSSHHAHLAAYRGSTGTVMHALRAGLLGGDGPAESSCAVQACLSSPEQHRPALDSNHLLLLAWRQELQALRTGNLELLLTSACPGSEREEER